MKRHISLMLVVTMLLSLFSMSGLTIEGRAVEQQHMHQHNFMCYEDVNVICGQDHEHCVSCYQGAGAVACGLEEGSYYTDVDVAQEFVGALLDCSIPEHQHDSGCTVQSVFDSGDGLFGTMGDVFGNDTFSAVDYVCGMQEHIHDDSCYQEIWSECAADSDVITDITDIGTNGVGQTQPGNNYISALDPDSNVFLDRDSVFGVNALSTSNVEMTLGWRTGTMEGNICVTVADTGTSVLVGPTLGIHANATINAQTISIRVPRYVESGRTNRDNVRGEFQPDVLSPEWAATASGDYYIVTNTTRLYSGNNLSTVLYYNFDTKATQSDKVWSVTAELLNGDGNITDTKSVQGKIRTSVGLTVSTARSVNNFVGIDSYKSYITSWSSWLEEYFGLTKAQFDSTVGNYVYDIITAEVTPTGLQDYTAVAYITPGAYPTIDRKDDNGQYYHLYGGGGRVVGAIAAPYDSATSTSDIVAADLQKLTVGNPVTLTASNAYNYDPSIVNATNYGCIRRDGVSASDFKAFPVSIPRSPDLTLVDRCTSYVISALIAYPKSSVVVRHDSWVAGKNILLDAGIVVTHNGIDSGSVSDSGNCMLFNNKWDSVHYGGDIYAAEYTAATEFLNRNALISDGTTMRVTSQFYALNVNRNNYSRDYAAPYTLDCMLDKVVLYINGQAVILNDDDYTFTSINIGALDTYGYAGIESDGTFKMFFEDTSVIPKGKENEVLSVYYGTSHNSTTDWKLYSGKQITLGDCWNTSGRDSYSVDLTGITASNITHIKVQYPTSQHLTRIMVSATIKLFPTEHVRSLMSEATGNMWVTNWLAYHAYDYNGNIDLVVERATVDTSGDLGATGDAVRSWDDGHKYTGAGSGYPYRNFIYTEIVEATDFAGMAVSHVLVNGDGTTQGKKQFVTAGNYSQEHSVTEVDRVVLGFMGALFDASTLGVFLGDEEPARTLGTLAEEIRSDSSHHEAYQFAMQRYYVLLPAGFTIDAASGGSRSIGLGPGFLMALDNIRAYSRQVFTTSHTLSNVLSKVGSDVYPSAHGYFGGVIHGTSKIYPTVTTTVVQGRELVTITIPYGDSNGDYDRQHGVGISNNSYSSLCITPVGVGDCYTLVMVPKNGGTVPSGLYEVQIAAEFLDENGKAYDLSSFDGAIYDDLRDAFPSSPLGDILDRSEDGKTYLAIADYFQNISGNGNTYAQVLVNDSFTADLDERGDMYTYSLNYGISAGTSTNVVLFDALETETTAGNKPEWQGTINYVDMNGTGATLWVNRDGIDLEQYQSSKADASWLTKDRGWERVTNPESYTGYAGVKALAVDFGSKVFDSTVEADSKATIYVHMTSSTEVSSTGEEIATTYNEIAFYDKHSTETTGTVICNEVQVTVPVEQRAFYTTMFPETGGAGTLMYLMAGTIMSAIGIYLIRKRKVTA